MAWSFISEFEVGEVSDWAKASPKPIDLPYECKAEKAHVSIQMDSTANYRFDH